jgi:hypothetical protein
MAELSQGERVQLSQMSGDMMTLLLLDDLWTESAQQQLPYDELGVLVGEQVVPLVRRISEASQFIGSLPERMGDVLQERFDALMWGEGLSAADRDDLRWLVSRAGGSTGLAQSAAEALANSEAEIKAMEGQLERLRSGEKAAGDLSRKFRCGLGCGLLISGVAALPVAAGAGAAAAVTVAAGAVAAGLLVGGTSGVGAIAIIVAAIVVMRHHKC